MATVSRGLPERPHLDIPKRLARELLDQWRTGVPEALARIRHRHPKFLAADDAALRAASFQLSDAQLVIAREYGFQRWTELKLRVESNSLAQSLDAAIRANDRAATVHLIQLQPDLLHIPVVSGNWGPPMSHAANMGRLEIVRAMAALGARDFQHAFDRAILQGRLECARWLHEHGATNAPGLVMGPCETLNVAGLRFLAELNAPFTDHRGDPLAPLALTLQTYCRKPAEKHQILSLFAERGYELPDTPMMAFHRGDIPRLEQFLRHDPHLLERHFTLREIYPPECGCGEDDRSGMHWTPIHGTTLLHIAVDFRETQIFEWLLAHGANPDAPAAIDNDGFGGHTPLFNAVVCGPWPDATFARRLLERGASKDARANLRKFLDWIDTPHWHEVRNVTPAQWGHTFPEKNWINPAALQLLDEK